mmetsp:Transcript_50176/g.83153  ORF Transcript_50176/g.83153 Transcript_50176/m.83153 type:complete len:259 (-) Transcript_50176:14-790(-)
MSTRATTRCSSGDGVSHLSSLQLRYLHLRCLLWPSCPGTRRANDTRRWSRIHCALVPLLFCLYHARCKNAGGSGYCRHMYAWAKCSGRRAHRDGSCDDAGFTRRASQRFATHRLLPLRLALSDWRPTLRAHRTDNAPPVCAEESSRRNDGPRRVDEHDCSSCFPDLLWAPLQPGEPICLPLSCWQCCHLRCRCRPIAPFSGPSFCTCLEKDMNELDLTSANPANFVTCTECIASLASLHDTAYLGTVNLQHLPTSCLS